MKVLLITHGSYLNPETVVSGNSVRAYYLARGLRHHGIEVAYAYPAELDTLQPSAQADDSGITLHTYRDRDELQHLIRTQHPTLLYVGYWELLEEIPDDLANPVVVDVVAPRILEALYQEERVPQDEVERMLRLYRRADRFICGTERQKHFLLPWLLLAGFDCRFQVPVDVIPLSTIPGQAHRVRADPRGLRFVSGGVVWPWRRTEPWFDALVTALRAGEDEFLLFTGKYIYNPAQKLPDLSAVEQSWPKAIVHRQPLLPYGEMGDFLSRHCDIGVELADRNTEREYSHSFRATEFLRCGLPVIVNDYLELAGDIRRMDAGWVIQSADQVPAIIEEIRAAPEGLQRKSANAIRLVEESFHCIRTILPLVEFIKQPRMPERREPLWSLHEPQQHDIAATLSKAQTPSEPVPLTAADGPPAATNKHPSPVPRAPAARQPARTGARPKQLLIGLAGRLARLGKKHAPGDRIAMVTRSDISPADHGAAVKIDRTAQGLSQLVDRIYIISDDRQYYFEYRKGRRSRHPYPTWLTRVGPDPKQISQRLEQRGIPLSDAFLYYPVEDWSFIARTLYLTHRKGISIFQAEFPAYARACLWAKRLFGGKTLLVEHNVEYQRLCKQFPELPDAVKDYLRTLEVYLCNEVDTVITVSEADKQRLIEDGVAARKVHTVPHGVDLESFKQSRARDLRREFNIPPEWPLLVYHGIYLYPPNLEAMQIMAEEILPRLHQAGKRVKVIAIGRNPPTESPHEDILFTGSVENIAPYLLGADMAVVPLRRGGGTRMKILDYFAASLPVVSSSKGIEGIPVENGVQARICDDWQAMAAAITELLDNPAQAASLATNGHRFAADLDWRNISSRYLDLIRRTQSS